jgi:hypothetical protein
LEARIVEPNKQNPYANKRNLPVGKLEYPARSSDLWTKGVMLEYGEPELIYSIPRLVSGGLMINLGDAQGGSAILLAQGLRDEQLAGCVYTVDCYKIIQVPATTDDAFDGFFKTFGCPQFSFLFIDAGHKYENVKTDWLNYSPLVVEGGLVGFHDSNQEDIDRVIEECVDWELVEWVNRIKVFKKS